MEKIKSLGGELIQNIDFHSIFLYFLTLSNCSFLLYILLIGSINPLLVDDLAFLGIYHDYGILGGIQWWYNNWQGRFGPHLLINLTVGLFEVIQSTLPFIVFLIFVFVYSLRKILRLTILNNESIKNKNLLAINFATLIFNLLLIVSFKFETFFWINVSAMYFGGVAFFLLGVSEVLSKSTKAFSFILLILSFLYVGSSSEHVGALATAALLLSVILVFKLKVERSKNASFKLLLACGVCGTSFLLMILAPGNEIRRALYPEGSIVESFPIAFNSLLSLLYQIIWKSHYYMALSFPFVYFGTLLRKNTSNHFKFFTTLLLTIPVLLVCLYIFMIPMAYATSSIGPYRALVYIPALLTLIATAIAFSFGYYTRISQKIALSFGYLSCFLLLYLGIHRINQYVPATIAYVKSNQTRIDKLLELKAANFTGTYSMPPLISGENNVLHFAEISDDPNYFVNQSYYKGLGLDFKIILKKD